LKLLLFMFDSNATSFEKLKNKFDSVVLLVKGSLFIWPRRLNFGWEIEAEFGRLCTKSVGGLVVLGPFKGVSEKWLQDRVVGMAAVYVLCEVCGGLDVT